MTGRTHAGSDLDVAVLPEPGADLSLQDPVHLTADLAQLATERLLERLIGRLLDINEVDPAKVHAAAAEALADVPRYLDCIQQFLDRLPDNTA